LSPITSPSPERAFRLSRRLSVAGLTVLTLLLAVPATSPATAWAPLRITAGDETTCYSNGAGLTSCWGYNGWGQLGIANTDDQKTPIYIALRSAADSFTSQVAAGANHTCALVAPTEADSRLGNKTLKCWGADDLGQSGGRYTNTLTGTPYFVVPTTVSWGRHASKISLGYDFGCARTADLRVKCWGDNTSGQLGIGGLPDTSVIRRPVPRSLGAVGVPKASDVSAGFTHACATMKASATTTAGTIKCWGSNSHGQLGNGTTSTAETRPVTVSTIGSNSTFAATAIAAGNGFTCALVTLPANLVLAQGITGGQVQCWGANDSGQLGNRANLRGSHPDLSTPGAVLDRNNLNSYEDCTMTTGNVKVCGTGTLGNSGVVTTSSPSGTCDKWVAGGVLTQPAGASLAAGQTVGTKYPGAVVPGVHPYCSYAQTFGSDTARLVGVTQIVVGDSHACAIIANGWVSRVACWGSNSNGQLGNGTNTDSSEPVLVKTAAGTPLSSVVGLAAGGNHTCAILSGEQVFCWGENSSGQLGNNSLADSNIPVAVQFKDHQPVFLINPPTPYMGPADWSNPAKTMVSVRASIPATLQCRFDYVNADSNPSNDDPGWIPALQLNGTTGPVDPATGLKCGQTIDLTKMYAPVKEGAHSIEVRQFDGSGWTTADPVEFVVDTVLPSIAAAYFRPVTSTNPSSTLVVCPATGSVLDANEIAGAEYSTATALPTATTAGIQAPESTFNLSPGDLNLRMPFDPVTPPVTPKSVRIRDAAGNWSAWTKVGTAPTTTCQ